MILGISISRRIPIDNMEREDREKKIKELAKHAYAMKAAAQAKQEEVEDLRRRAAVEQQELEDMRRRAALAEIKRVEAVRKEWQIRREERFRREHGEE